MYLAVCPEEIRGKRRSFKNLAAMCLIDIRMAGNGRIDWDVRSEQHAVDFATYFGWKTEKRKGETRWEVNTCLDTRVSLRDKERPRWTTSDRFYDHFFPN
jgi:hypothetical protein